MDESYENNQIKTSLSESGEMLDVDVKSLLDSSKVQSQLKASSETIADVMDEPNETLAEMMQKLSECQKRQFGAIKKLTADVEEMYNLLNELKSVMSQPEHIRHFYVQEIEVLLAKVRGESQC